MNENRIIPIIDLLIACREFVVQDMKMHDIEYSPVLDSIDYYISFEGPL